MNNLDKKLASIGFQLSGSHIIPISDFIDIESVIHEASLECSSDSRLISLISSWVIVHGDKVIIEKLMRKQKTNFSIWLVAIAIIAEKHGIHKWKRLIKKSKTPIYLIDKDLSLSAIKLKGIEEGMEENNYFIPKGTIRIRERDVLTIKDLALQNPQYRNRMIFGSSIRSDIITAIQFGLKTPYIIAKTIGCSYEPAHRIFNEYKLYNETVSKIGANLSAF